jgi:hypothetical protein
MPETLQQRVDKHRVWLNDPKNKNKPQYHSVLQNYNELNKQLNDKYAQLF